MSGSPRRALRALKTSLGLQWRAARNETLVVVAGQAVDAALLAAQLLFVQRLLAGLAASPRPSGSAFVPSLVGLTACYAMRAIVGAVVTERRSLTGELVERDVNLRVLEAASRATVADFENPAFHDQLTHVRGQAYQHAYSMTWAAASLTTELFITISMVVVLISFSPWILAVAVTGVVPFFWASRRRNRVGYELTRDQVARDRERRYLEDVLTKRTIAAEMRSLSLAAHFLGRIGELYDLRLADVRIAARRRLVVSMVSSLVAAALAAASLTVLVVVAVHGDLGVAEAGVAVLALQQLTNQLRGAVDVLGEIDNGVPFIEDFTAFEFRASVLPPLRTSAPEHLPALESLELTSLGFTYPGTDAAVLRNLSVTVRGGEVVALVGHNGSGKSTLAKLLSGLYAPTTGAILWNGVDIAEVDETVVRGSVALMFQDFAKFELTAFENVSFGEISARADRARVSAAVRSAGATELLASMPRGFETRLSRSFEDGVELSGGQWQRLALARAYFRDAPLVVLDEPAAALDPLAERALFEDLRALGAGRTVVMISHRFSTVRNADRILVLEAGELVEDGTHDQLMARRGRYAQLFSAQAAPFLDRPILNPQEDEAGLTQNEELHTPGE